MEFIADLQIDIDFYGIMWVCVTNLVQQIHAVDLYSFMIGVLSAAFVMLIYKTKCFIAQGIRSNMTSLHLLAKQDYYIDIFMEYLEEEKQRIE